MRDYPARVTKHSTKNAVGLPTKKSSAAKEYERKDERLRSYTLSDSQKEIGGSIRSNVVTFVAGDAGTGKSFGALHPFCDDFITDVGVSLLVIRTPAEAGDDPIGFLKGVKEEKIAPHFSSVQKILEQFLGKGTVESSMGSRIFYEPPNFMLGDTWDNMRVLIDEAQMMGPGTMNLLLSRIGENCKVVVSGSSAQIFSTDRKPRNGLDDALELFFEDLDHPEFEPSPRYPDFGLVIMSEDSQMRNSVVSSVNHAYKRNRYL